MGDLKKKWRALVHKVSYLKFELDDRKEKLKKFEDEIGGKVSSTESSVATDQAPKNEIVDQVCQETSQEKLDEEKIVERQPTNEQKEFKKLWRQIAIKTHPDVAGDDPNLLRAYKAAVDAWNKGEVEVLIDIAVELQIEIEDPTEEMILVLEKRASSMQEEINKHESSVAWAWGHADVDKQSIIIDELLKYRRNRYKG